jgi:hypothetical protein
VADVTGILAAGALSVLGLFVLAAKRARTRADLAGKVTALREKLIGALVPAFERERDRSQQRIREAIAFWVRFVRTEKDSLEEARAVFARIDVGVGSDGSRIDGLLNSWKTAVPRLPLVSGHFDVNSYAVCSRGARVN